MNFDALPSEWRTGSLAEIGHATVAKLDPRAFPEELFEYYSIPAFQNGASATLTAGAEILSHKLLIPPRCVLFGKLNPRVEKVWNVRSTGGHRRLASTEWLTLLPTDGVDQDFLYFLMYSEWVMPIAKTLVSGSTPSRQRVNEKAFFDIRVPLPSIQEQRRLGYVLRLVHGALGASRSAITAGTALRAEAMRTLFTRGLRSEPTKETEIGQQPRSWTVESLGQLGDRGAIQITMGQSPPSSTYNESGVGSPFFQGSADFGSLHPSTRIWCDRVRKFARAGDTLLSVRAPVGDVNVASEECGIGRGLASIAAGADFDAWFLYFVLLHRKPNLVSMGSGSTFAGVSRATLRQLSLPVPALGEQEEIATALLTIERRIEVHRSKFSLLEQMFKTLLHDLMTGGILAEDIDLSNLGASVDAGGIQDTQE